ncbi:MAG: DUF4126 domain-containing protein [Candidatus Eisenbacteria bacterium]
MSHTDLFHLGLALVGGVVIAATTGLRAFLPLFALGIAGRLGWWPVEAHLKWLQSTPALVALGVATLLEMAGDKIPVVDHLLDAVGTVVRPVAGVIGSFVVLQAWPTPWGQIAAIVLGGLTLGVHGLKAKTRLASSVATLGTANPALSIVEDVLALVGTVFALVLPFVALFVVLLAIGLLLRAMSRPGRVATPASGRPAS